MIARLSGLAIACALGGAWLAGPAPAGEAPTAKPAGKAVQRRAPEGPVEIRSDTLKVHQKKHTAVFTGNVRAVQGELRIRCRELTVRYSGEGARASTTTGDIEQMLFTGDVHIHQADRRGHCERADYQRPAGRIVCTGDPWVIEGDNRIAGDRIVYLLDADEVRVTRPRAVLQLPADGGTRPGKGQ